MKRALQLLNISFWCTVVLVFTVGNASAGTINCGVPAERMMELTNVEACNFGAGNLGGNPASLATIAGYYPGAWSLVGEPVAAGSEDGFTITGGPFGGGDASGTWAIDSSFWVTYGAGVITAHVGGGQGNPEHWAFLVTSDSLTGNWAYDLITAGAGGGLSNFKLYGSGTGTSVPEPGILSLLGIGLLGLGLSRRRIKS